MTSDGLCWGYESGVLVTDDYRSPFRFTGAIKRVVVEVDGPARVDLAARTRAAMNTQ